MIKKIPFNTSVGAGSFGLLVLLMVAFQVAFVEKMNPPVAHEPQWDSPETLALVEKSVLTVTVIKLDGRGMPTSGRRASWCISR